MVVALKKCSNTGVYGFSPKFGRAKVVMRPKF